MLHFALPLNVRTAGAGVILGRSLRNPGCWEGRMAFAEFRGLPACATPVRLAGHTLESACGGHAKAQRIGTFPMSHMASKSRRL